MTNFLNSRNSQTNPLPPMYEDRRRSSFQEFASFIWETVKVIVISLAIILPIRFFIIQPFYVKGASMEPSFFDHEYLIIDEISYHIQHPQRGQVVVFRYPENPGQFFIKRLIGLPGERVHISNGSVTIYQQGQKTGLTLDETYLDPGTRTAGEIDLLLKEGQYYVLGDNRGASFDSRSFGILPAQNIVGKVLFRGWPISRIAFFPSISY